MAKDDIHQNRRHPNIAVLQSPPGSVAIDVKVPHGEHLGSMSTFWTDLRPRLCPAVIAPPEKLKWILLHFPVFVPKMLFDNRSAILHPVFVASCCSSNIHMGRKHLANSATPAFDSNETNETSLFRPCFIAWTIFSGPLDSGNSYRLPLAPGHPPEPR